MDNSSIDSIEVVRDISLPLERLFAVKDLVQGERVAAWLDRQIGLLGLYKTHVYTLCNRLTPVSRLPTEILVHIFGYCRAQEKDKTHSGSLAPNFSRVCRFWRNAALGDPALWANVSFRSPRLAKEMLLRAQAYPLDVTIDISAARRLDRKDAYMKESMDILNTRVKRVRSLQVTTTAASDINKLLPNLFNSEASLLECIDITATLNYPGFARNLRPITAPSLKHLRLVRCPLTFRFGQSWDHLTKLEMVDCALHDIHYPSVLNIIGILKSARSIQEVSLLNTLALNPDPTSTTHLSPICLPVLTSLVIEDMGGHILDLLRLLSVPALSHLSLEFTYLNMAQIQAFLEQLQRIMPNSCLTSQPSRLMLRYAENILHICQSVNTPGNVQTPQHQGKNTLDIRIAAFSHTDACDILSPILQGIPLGHIHTVDKRTAFGLQIWTALLAFPGLSQLHIYHETLTEFCDALGGMETTFQHVSSVVLEDLHAMNDGFMIRKTVGSLRNHVDIGMPLKTLHFRGCGPTREEVEHLAESLGPGAFAFNVLGGEGGQRLYE